MEQPEQRNNKQKKWSRNGITYYYWCGKLCECNSKRPRLNKHKKKDGTPLVVSEKQTKSRSAFSMITHFKDYYFKQIKGLPIWNVAPRKPGQTGRSLFHHENFGACGPQGISYFPEFKFSVGELQKSRNIQVTREEWTLTVTWENQETCHSALITDILRVGYFYDSHPASPRLFPDPLARRGEGKAVFTIPDETMTPDETLHVYLFFAREDGSAFSPDFYARV